MKKPITNTDTKNRDVKKAAIRMFIGGIIGFLLFFGLAYLWMVYKNNVNPLSGLGALAIGSIGLVLGALLSIFSKSWSRK